MVFYFLLFMAFIVNQVCGQDTNNCNSSRCGDNGPLVRFPFRIKGKQARNCGYPQHWFDLSCSENNETVMQLTSSWKLSIKHINYTSQLISAYYSEDCLPKRLLGSRLSLAPFKFYDSSSILYDYTLFNCSTAFVSEQEIPCLSNFHYKVYAIASYVDIDDHMDLFMSCIKIQDIPSVPYDYLYYKVTVLDFSWSHPDCTSCEAKGGHCRLQANTNESSQTQCYGHPKPGISTKFVPTGVTLGSILLVGAVLSIYGNYSYDKTRREYQSKINKFLDNYKSFKPTRFSYAHIKRMTNQFKDELGQGAYGTVFRGKLSPEILVAVKLLNNSRGNGEELVNEVRAIGKIHHVNVVRLFGFCADGFRRALVYEYLPNDSLQKFISSPDDTSNHFLGWKRLQDIAHGIAKGIEYLVELCFLYAKLVATLKLWHEINKPERPLF